MHFTVDPTKLCWYEDNKKWNQWMYPCGFKLYASSYDINIVVQMIYRTKEICAIMLCTVISITINTAKWIYHELRELLLK